MNEEGTFTSKTAFCIQREFSSPMELIWSYLVEFDKRREWFPAWDVDPGKYVGAYGVDPAEIIKSRVLVAKPPSRLQFTWPRRGGGDSQGEILLTLSDVKVLVKLTLSRLAAPEERRTSNKVDNAVSAAACWHWRLDTLQAKLSGTLFSPWWSEGFLRDSVYESSYMKVNQDWARNVKQARRI